METINLAPRFSTKEEVAEVEAAADALKAAAEQHAADRAEYLSVAEERMDEIINENRSRADLSARDYYGAVRHNLLDNLQTIVDTLNPFLCNVLVSAAVHRAASERFLVAMSKAR